MDVNNRLQMIRNNQQMMQNPMVKNVFSMLDQRNSKGLMDMFKNTCSNKGINPNEYLNMLKK